MYNSLQKLEREIRSLKHQLPMLDENMQARVREEISNLEFDLNYLQKTIQFNVITPAISFQRERAMAVS